MGIATGDRVRWRWGDGHGEGCVTQPFTQKTTLSIKGTDVTRNASPDDPAFLIKQDDGDTVLKSASEVEKSQSQD